MTDLLLIADDLTGAADSGVPFAAAGFTTAIPFDRPRHEQADVIALSTESRDVSAAEAERRVRTALIAIFGRDGARRPAWIYKKMDSALRGNPVEELLITMQVARAESALIAPALPSQGRTTVGGVVYDRGIRLSETPLGQEHGRDNLVRLFQRSSRIPIRSLDLTTVRGNPRDLRNALSTPGSWIAIADAETEADLDQLAQIGIAAGIRLFSGSAGLTGVLARRLPVHQIHRPPPVTRQPRPILVVAGSRHEVTARQIVYAEERGARVIRLDQQTIDDSDPDLTPINARIHAALSGPQPVIVTTVGLFPSRLDGSTVANRLAAVTVLPGLANLTGGLVLTGGDIAATICRMLGVQTIWLRGEILPAIPWATLTGDDFGGLPIVTKAGSFGPPEAIQTAITHLQSLSRSDPL